MKKGISKLLDKNLS